MLTQQLVSAMWSCRLAESPYKVVLEQLVGLEPSAGRTGDGQEEEEERQMLLQRPLEICLTHSTIHTADASTCPLVRPQFGVAALHEYVKWVCELKDKRGDADRKKSSVCWCLSKCPAHSSSS